MEDWKASDYIASTNGGRIKGVFENGIVSFRNIPYTAPFTGTRRFLPSLPAEPWQGIKDGTHYGKICPQVLLPQAPFAEKEDLSEDCLSLNVYTPPTAGENLPVLFFIHGGAFYMGSHALAFNPEQFVKKGIICVTCNYRIGVLGFAQLDEYLGEEYRQSGNSGLLDITLALRWVKDNIANFGGDPDHVTISGSSAGAKIASTLLVMPSAAGLFSGAILQSGSTQCIRDIDTARQIADRYVEAMGLNKSNAKEMLSMPWEELLSKQGVFTAGAENLHSFGPVFDGINFTDDDALRIIRSGNANYVNILGGYARDEAQMYYNFGLRELSEHAAQYLFGLYGKRIHDQVNEQLSQESDENKTLKFVQIMSEYLYGNPTIQMFDAFSEANQPGKLFLYRIDWDEMPSRAHHGIDGALVYNERGMMFTGVEEKPGFTALSAKMITAWEHFIKAYNPYANDLPLWTPYTKDSHNMMRFDKSCEMTSVPPLGYDSVIDHQIIRL